MNKEIEIPFGAKDSELKGWEYTIPENMEAEIKDGKIIVKQKESDDEEIKKFIIDCIDELRRANAENADFNGQCSEAIAYLERQKEQQPVMIQWTGKNLKEVIDFTGKSQKFGEWFKSWEEYENYVHAHNDILKLFCEDGSHYEVPVGAWIVKTPDGYNTPSRFRFIQKPAEWSDEEIVNWAYDNFRVSSFDMTKIVTNFSSMDELERSLREKLKSLRPQPHQTVEDKSISKEILEYFNEKKDYRSRWYVWVKYASRNPHWKPSEEQMWALDVALENFYDQNDRAALESLRIDLKKL